MLILVTGARGAIGRKVVETARAAGHSIVGLGHGAWSGDNELPVIDRWVNGDVDADNLSVLFKGLGLPDAVVHLAGGSLVGPSMAQPSEDFRRSVEGAQRLFEWLRNNAPQARVVFASSAAVYGDEHAATIPENVQVAPKSPYGTHKAMVELLAASYARQFSMRVAILRLFSVYGPGVRKQLVWELANRVLAGERTLALAGTGGEKRDFLYVSDAASILVDAIGLASEAAPVFNGASGVATPISIVAESICTRLGHGSVVFSGIQRPGDPFALVAECSRAAAAGLVARTPFAEGLAQTVDWIAATRSRGGAL